MPVVISIWICFCAYLNCAGWALSAIHQLNAAGYAVALTIWFLALFGWRKKASKEFLPKIHWKKNCLRFKKIFPLIFLIVAALEFIGGVIYPPNNYDALTYRLPRILNWLAAGHWFWISTINERMNYTTPAWEWIATPFFALLHSDRAIFLINALGYLLMPGLLFSVFRQLGVARKVAWTWMWIFPLAYGYGTQAGSVGNDLLGALFALASIFFGLRARRSEKIQDIWLAILAAALMTNTKLSNLPLLLPCLLAVWPVLIRLRERWLATLAVVGISILISALPTMALNQIHTGSWTGDPQNLGKMQVKNPAAAFLGNGLLLLQQSFMPPVLPDARKANNLMDEKLPLSWRKILAENFPRYFDGRFNELPQEEAAGIGLGITLLLLFGIVIAIWKCSWPKITSGMLVGFAAWIAAAFYMMKMGSEATGRIMLPYYPLAVVPFLLLPSQNFLLRFRAWRIFVVVAALSVLPAVILSPSRPLFPALSFSERLALRHLDSVAAQRLATVYSTYANRHDSLAPLRDALPFNAKKIGFIAGENDTDYSLWQPFGQRQVVYLQTDVQKSNNIPRDIKWIVVNGNTWPQFSNLTLEKWANQHDATITMTVPIVTFVSSGKETWCLLHRPQP